MAIGAFPTTDYALLRSRVIMAPNAGPNPYAPIAPPRLPTVPIFTPPALPTSRFPIPTTVIGDPIIRMPTLLNDAPPPPPPPSPAGTGATTGAASGGTGTSDTSRLLDMIAGAFQPQAVSPSLAPTSVASTSTGDSSSGSNPLVLLIVGAVVIGGIMWYVKRKAA